MSYDLHGAWDSDNPIGSIVQGHTNLTEIKLAAELFWRVEIPPEKLLIGFGFYGRSFTLADTSCTAPGCQFSGAGKKGPCTDTGGILGYYEIQNIINGAGSKKRAAPVPIHDEASAVNYLVFDDDQWISYDDAASFKQKTEWANSIGLGGSLIWASDLGMYVEERCDRQETYFMQTTINTLPILDYWTRRFDQIKNSTEPTRPYLSLKPWWKTYQAATARTASSTPANVSSSTIAKPWQTHAVPATLSLDGTMPAVARKNA
jgi:hypothetical protein